MTVKEVLDTVDSLRPNEIGKADKLGWLMDIESRIYEDIYLTHEHNGISFTDTEKIGTDDSTVLFVKRPFSEIYILFLCSLIDFYHAEYERYANDEALYETLYDEFCRYWNARHMSNVKTRMKG